MNSINITPSQQTFLEQYLQQSAQAKSLPTSEALSYLLAKLQKKFPNLLPLLQKLLPPPHKTPKNNYPDLLPLLQEKPLNLLLSHQQNYLQLQNPSQLLPLLQNALSLQPPIPLLQIQEHLEQKKYTPIFHTFLHLPYLQQQIQQNQLLPLIQTLQTTLQHPKLHIPPNFQTLYHLSPVSTQTLQNLYHTLQKEKNFLQQSPQLLFQTLYIYLQFLPSFQPILKVWKNLHPTPYLQSLQPLFPPPHSSLQYTLHQHTNTISDLAFSPTGNLLASASWDKSLCLWQTSNPQKPNQIHTPYPPHNLSFHPNSPTLAIADRKGTIYLLNLPTPSIKHATPLQLPDPAPSPIQFLTYSPKGNYLAALTLHKLYLWQTSPPKLLLQSPLPQAQCLTFHPNETYLAIAEYNQIQLLQLPSLQWQNTLHHALPITSLLWTNQQRLLSGDEQGLLTLWDTTSQKKLYQIQAHSSPITSLDIHPNYLLSTSLDKTIKLWQNQTCLQTWLCQNPPLKATLHPHQPLLASCHNNHTIQIWNILQPNPQKQQIHKGKITSISTTTHSPLFATSSSDHQIQLHHPDENTTTLKGHLGLITSTSLHPHQPLLASTSWDKTIRIWNLSTKKCQLILQRHLLFINHVQYNPTGDLLASASWDKTIRIWNSQTGQHLGVCAGHNDVVTTAVFSPCGHRIASGSWDKTIKIWDTLTKKCLLTLQGHTDKIHSLAWHPQGLYLLSASEDTTIRLWHPLSGKCLHTLQGHQQSVQSVSIDPQGKWIVSASLDKTIKIWCASTQHCLYTLPPQPCAIHTATFYNNNQTILFGDEKGYLYQLPNPCLLNTEPPQPRQLPTPICQLQNTPNSLVSTSPNGKIYLWNKQNATLKKEIQTHVHKILTLQTNHDHDKILTASLDKSIKISCPHTGKILYHLPLTSPPNTAALSSSAQSIAYALNPNQLYLHHLTNQQTITQNIPHPPLSLTFHPQLPKLLCLDSSPSLSIWNTNPFKILYYLPLTSPTLQKLLPSSPYPQLLWQNQLAFIKLHQYLEIWHLQQKKCLHQSYTPLHIQTFAKFYLQQFPQPLQTLLHHLQNHPSLSTTIHLQEILSDEKEKNIYAFQQNHLLFFKIQSK